MREVTVRTLVGESLGNAERTVGIQCVVRQLAAQLLPVRRLVVTTQGCCHLRKESARATLPNLYMLLSYSRWSTESGSETDDRLQ